MNWCLLLLLLKTLTVNWAAPVDLLETKDELQQDKNILDNLINPHFSVTDETNSLIKTTENFISSSKNETNNTSLDVPGLNENVHQQNLMLEVPRELESSTEYTRAEKDSEDKRSKRPNSNESTQSLPTVILKEFKQEEIFTSTPQYSKINSSGLVENVEYGHTLTVSSNDADKRVTKKLSSDLNYSTKTSGLEDVITTPVNDENTKENLINKSTESHDKTSENPSVSDQVTEHLASTLKKTTQHFHPETVITTIPSIEKSLYDLENTNNQASKVISNEAEKYTEMTSNKELKMNSPSDQQQANNQDPETISHFVVSTDKHLNVEEVPSSTTESVSIIPDDTSSTPESISSTSMPIASEVQQYHSEPFLTAIPNYTTNQTKDDEVSHRSEQSYIDIPTVKQADDSYLINASSLKQPVTEFPINRSEIEISKQEMDVNFKETVDFSIKELAEIGSTMGLIPEDYQSKIVSTTKQALGDQENLKRTTETAAELGFKYRQDATANPVSELKQSLNDDGQFNKVSSNVTITKISENVTTLPLLETFEENSEHTPKTDISNLSTSAENLIEETTEIAGDFNNAVSDLYIQAAEIPSFKTTTTQEGLTTWENREDSSTQETSTKTSSIDIDGSYKTQLSNEILQNSSKEFLNSADINYKDKQSDHKQIEVSTGQVSNENLKATEYSKTESVIFRPKFAEYIPVTVITIPEENTKMNTSTQQTEFLPQNLEPKNLVSATEQEVQATKSEVENSKHIKSELTEATITEHHHTSTIQNERETTFTTAENELFKPDDLTTSYPINQQEKLTSGVHTVIEETTANIIDKLENTLQSLIQKDKLQEKEGDVYTTPWETTHQKPTTLVPSTTISGKLSTTTSGEEVTILPKMFEHEIQMAVKALEETTHHHFEEFQNNLKEALKKVTVWGADHEKPEETTYNATRIEPTTDPKVTQQTLVEHSTILKTKEDSLQNINMGKDLLKMEEPHRIGVINQRFVDKFADSYEEAFDTNSTEMQIENVGSKQMSELQGNVAEVDETTETPLVVSNILQGDGKEQVAEKEHNDLGEITTGQNDVEENFDFTEENIVPDNNEEDEKIRTEFPSETTLSTPVLARLSLQKDVTSVSLSINDEAITNSPTQQPTIQSEQLKETHAELIQTTRPMETAEEIITLPTLEDTINKMVTFIKLTNTTAGAQQVQQPKENSATSQTQEPLTQASFMEEQQQQIESTTEHEAQTQTAAASGQTDVTAKDDNDGDTLKQQTTEAEIHSTTVVEQDELTATATTTTAPVEPEARSLSLPPPKLEYLHTEDGVEVFYGYSIVKRN